MGPLPPNERKGKKRKTAGAGGGVGREKERKKMKLKELLHAILVGSSQIAIRHKMDLSLLY